ncbi:hypothetical protein E0F15_11285 [Frankia sp. B2]|uniref:hypothetical protein n=1 Tax=unclassified Frankia TaxID=2632575 RepID=UPI000461CEA8|nr:MULTISPECIES: hypothetical protein [unclassified Frankia]KDA40759.1 hypothetical protein BMG523Draft_04423 [Frankia sp. BMG5.23]TFE30431.1 hypothetical protein E0F15_11285 [Frankia sp. B2]
MILFLLFFFMLALAIPLWRFLAIFMPVSFALWTLSWALTTSTPGYGKYMIPVIFILLAARQVSKWTRRT